MNTMMKWRDERLKMSETAQTHTHKRSPCINVTIVTHMHTLDGMESWMLIATYEKWVILPLYNSLCLSCSVLWMSKHPRLPIHPRLQSVFYQCDLIHLPCITVLVIITLLYFNRSPSPFSSSYHQVWLKISTADGGRDCLVVSSAGLFFLVLFLWCS